MLLQPQPKLQLPTQWQPHLHLLGMPSSSSSTLLPSLSAPFPYCAFCFQWRRQSFWPSSLSEFARYQYGRQRSVAPLAPLPNEACLLSMSFQAHGHLPSFPAHAFLFVRSSFRAIGLRSELTSSRQAFLFMRQHPLAHGRSYLQP